jgi:HSP20 family protein
MSTIKRDDRLLNPGFPAFFNDFFTRDLWNWNPENHSPAGTTLPAVNIR